MFSGVFKQARSFKLMATPCLANTLLSRLKKAIIVMIKQGNMW